MLNRDTVIQLVALLVLVVCLGVVGASSGMIASEAGRAQLTYADEATEGDPPEVALGIAMGAFRGLFVNYLWIRVNQLKEAGKFYEAIELSSAITRLQPRFPRVWAFHAWNMSYNISVATNTAEERWQWVKAGIDLLRREGIPRNPNDVTLHRELAWIFNHKIQGYADDANHFYKRELCREWQIVLGPPPELQGTPEDNREAMAAWLQPLVETPETLEAVAERERRELDAKGVPGETGPDGVRLSRVLELADLLRTRGRLELDANLLRLVEMRRAWINSWYIAEREFKVELTPGDRNAVLDEAMGDPRFEDAWPRLVNFVRRRVLLETYNMEPERMQRFTRRFGPLDWRHPSTHAIYWAYRGVEEGLERTSTTEFDTLNTDRIVAHAFMELFRYGQINYDLLNNEYFTLTNFDWIDPYSSMLEELIARGGFAVNSEERVYTLYASGYINFLKDVIRVYYTRGDIANAEKYHKKLRTWSGLNINDSTLIEQLKLPLAQFVEEEMKDRISTPYVALAEIENALTDAYLRGLGQGKPDVFKNRMEYASKLREAYLSTQSTRTLADPETLRMAEYVGESFADMAARVLLRLLSGGSFGNYRLGLSQAALLYRRTPLQLQRIIFDELRDLFLSAGSSISPEIFARLYPEPPGMEQFREELAKYENASDRARRRQIEWEKDVNRKQ